MHENDFDELFSQSNLYFMLAAETYNDQLSKKFSTWLYVQVWNRLMNENIRAIRKQRELVLLRTESSHIPADSKESADFKELHWSGELSRDAQCLFRLVRSGGMDVEMLTRHRANGLRKMFRFLRAHGWSRKRINLCFKNMKRIVE
jgi:hypothetical protein